MRNQFGRNRLHGAPKQTLYFSRCRASRSTMSVNKNNQELTFLWEGPATASHDALPSGGFPSIFHPRQYQARAEVNNAPPNVRLEPTRGSARRLELNISCVEKVTIKRSS
uniref:Uncharacterized protein n=1 Tax=Compsopogon caeruleus TaxID=31354 RepID=A0A7S1TAR8_9RHOD|mmetsp:Transcript_1466/g.2908  ORF Transcript_1466/g.2908 Transcript_1466/m.2908 type:complete len:110 (+) Transcript_1466:395-724(+)